MMKKYILLLLLPLSASASMFGEENIALLKLVTGQLAEIEQLAKTVGIAEENRQLLLHLNEGIERASFQINAIGEIIERSKHLDPSSIKSISKLNAYLQESESLHRSVSQIINAKLALIDVAIGQSAIQSETSYTMGQEMVKTGAFLSQEAAHASPGRAAQISASANSVKLVSDGVLLQSISHLTELTSMQLTLERDRMLRDSRSERSRQNFMLDRLSQGGKP